MEAEKRTTTPSWESALINTYIKSDELHTYYSGLSFVGYFCWMYALGISAGVHPKIAFQGKTCESMLHIATPFQAQPLFHTN